MEFNEYLTAQKARLRSMADDFEGGLRDLSHNDRAACMSGADAIDIVEEFMHTPCFRPDAPSADEEGVYARMRELLFRGPREAGAAAQPSDSPVTVPAERGPADTEYTR